MAGFLVAVLGAGRQGIAAAYDFIRNGHDVIITDSSQDAVANACNVLGIDRANGKVVDFRNLSEVAPVLKEAHGAVFAADYALNLELTKLAVEARCSTIDYGGNHDVVGEQHKLDQMAKQAGVSIIPDTGLTPGLAGVLVAGGIESLDLAKKAHIRVGGLPQDPDPPLNYTLLFSIRGLTNEYLEPSVVLYDGKRETRPSMTGLEKLEIQGREYEAFYTSGGVSTLPVTFGDTLEVLDCKTIRYPGHAELIKFAFDIGFRSEDTVSVGDQEIVPREVFEHMLVTSLPHDKPDVTLMRITVKGTKDGKEASCVYEMIDTYDPDSGLTSMQRTTAWPGTVILQMVLNGDIEEKGVLYQERVVPSEKMVTELDKRGIRISRKLQ